jgi:hypothetical protein
LLALYRVRRAESGNRDSQACELVSSAAAAVRYSASASNLGRPLLSGSPTIAMLIGLGTGS